MDFVRSYFSKNEPLTSWTLFSLLFVQISAEVHLYQSNFLQNPYFSLFNKYTMQQYAPNPHGANERSALSISWEVSAVCDEYNFLPPHHFGTRQRSRIFEPSLLPQNLNPKTLPHTIPIWRNFILEHSSSS